MIFDTYHSTIYCKDKYYKKFDNDDFFYTKSILYYKGYMIHRDIGPAIDNKHCVNKEWYLNGLRHREDGPAVKNFGNTLWYIKNKIYFDLNEYWTDIKIINLKKKSRVLDDI